MAATQGSEKSMERGGERHGRGAVRAALRRNSSLPDLQGRIIKAGLMEEYLRYRAGYMKWRSKAPGKQGGHEGAAGELGTYLALGTEKKENPLLGHYEHEDLVDAPQQFDFLYTVSYWVAIQTTVGAMVLTFCNCAPIFDTHQRLNPHLMHWLTLIGDLLFTLASYLNFFELINMKHGEDEPRNFFKINWSWLFPPGQTARVSVEGLVGIMAYLVGMLVWDIAAVADVMPFELEGYYKLAFVSLPNLIGGVCFVVGGACEVKHNCGKTPAFIEWWAAWFNCIGCVLFFAGVVCGFIPSTGMAKTYALAVGIVCFVVGGVLFIMLWRSNDFGLTLLRQVNDAVRCGGHVSLTHGGPGQVKVRLARPDGQHLPQEDEDEEGGDDQEKGLSARGVFFLVVFCWVLACASMNSVVSLFRVADDQTHLSEFLNCVLWVFGVLIALAIHSAITSVPNEQPYKLAMISARCMFLLEAMAQTYNLVVWLPQVPLP